MKKPSDDITDKNWVPVKHVLDVMSGFANDEGDNIYPSYKLIAQYTGLGERTVYRAIAYLLKHKILMKKQSYSLNIPLVIQLAADQQTVVDQPIDEYTVHQTVTTVHQTVNDSELLSTGQSLLSTGHINKELTTTISKKQQQQTREREGTVAAVLFNKLLSYGFLEKETNLLLTQYGERHIGGNLAYFEVKHQVRPVGNIPAWLRKAFSLNWANVTAPAVAVVAMSPVADEPTLEALKGFWVSLPLADRQASIQKAGTVGRLF